MSPATAEIKPPTDETSTKSRPTASASHVAPKRDMMSKSDNTSKCNAESMSGAKEQEKDVGNPEWPSKTENTIVMPSNSNNMDKGNC